MTTTTTDDPLVLMGLRASVPILLDTLAVRRCHEAFDPACPGCRATSVAEPTIQQAWGIMRPHDGALQNSLSEADAHRWGEALGCHVVTWWEISTEPIVVKRAPASDRVVANAAPAGHPLADLLASGACSPACLLALDTTCECRCRGEHHGAAFTLAGA